MKKLSIMIMALALVLGMAQCKKQTEQQANEPAGATMDVTVRVQGNTEKTDITSTGVVTWKQGDKLYVVGESQGLLGYVSAKADGDPATFSGSITALTSAQTLRFYYVGAREFTLDGSGNCTFDISGQDGSLAGIAANNQLMYGVTTGSITPGTTDFGTVSMTSVMAIAHLNINDGGAAVSGPVTVTGGFATSTFNAKTYTGGTLTGTAGDITMTFASPTTSTDCYLALLPGTQTLTFTTSDGKTKTLAEKDIAANTFYNAGSAIAVTLAAPTPAHEYVDLGLSVRWATCNLGATSPGDYGDYYQWGGVTSVTSTTIDVGWANCPGNGGSGSYDATAFGEWRANNLTADDILKPEVDAAHVVWGGDWRMPTEAEFTELINNTTRTWYASDNTEFGGVAGYKCVSKVNGYTDKYIFLPAAGVRAGTSLIKPGSYGTYWSSSLNTSNSLSGRILDFRSNRFETGSMNRHNGYSVRPVCPPQN